MSKAIPFYSTLIRGNEWKYVKECLDTGWVSSLGSFVERFEKTIADYVGTRYAIATVNGTSALHISLLACDVRKNDEVIVPALTFIATANVVRYCAAEPVFMDCQPDTLCLDTEKVLDFLKKEAIHKKNGYAYNRKTDRRIRAIIPVHIFGHPADMDPLIDICKEMRIDIIEDATESLGSEYKARKTAALGKIGCLSFNGNKIITTGGGGMVVTNDAQLAQRIRHLTTQARTDTLEYDHDAIGYNYRLSNIQAAMGIAQMEKLEEYISLKREKAWLYRNLLSRISDVEFIWEKPWAKSNFWFYTIRVPRRHKAPLIKYLLSRDIQVRPIWKPINSLSMYRTSQAYKIEKAKAAYAICINLPSSVGISRDEVEQVVENIAKYFKN